MKKTITTIMLAMLLPLAVACSKEDDSEGNVIADNEEQETPSQSGLPTLVTVAASEITSSAARTGGYVVSDGGSMVSARGVCWNTTGNPTLDNCDDYTEDGEGTGRFWTSMYFLTADATYYVRAYATNGEGTAYGPSMSFVTRITCGNADGGSTLTKGDNGALPGRFSVSPAKQVRFSAGNLQYSTTGTHACADGTTQPGTWCFAANQYDYIGAGNESVTPSYSGYIDLFGWGTSGWSSGAVCHMPYSTSTNAGDNYADFFPGGSKDNNLSGSFANADWGVYNAIRNGGNEPGKWRTLTQEEWEYLRSGRAGADTKWGKGSIDGVPGVVFLPDSWTLPTDCLFEAGNSHGWSTNSYSPDQWSKMEAAGALFLPAAGYRVITTLHDAGKEGTYWSSSARNDNYAYMLSFSGGGPEVFYSGRRNYGRSVRLVCD